MKQQQYTIKLTMLTPLCIGTGEKLSPYSDFVIEDKSRKIYYADQQLIQQQLAEKPKLIDEFVSGVANGMDDNRSRFNLDAFLIKKLGIDIRQQHRLQLHCAAKANKQQLYTVVKNAGVKPYIPGTSMKGAVKTALLYDWLINKETGKQLVNRILQHPNNPGIEKEILQQFGRYNPGVSDSLLIDTDRIECIDTKRLHIKKGDAAIPQTWESVVAGTNTHITLSTKEREDQEYFEWPALRKAINQFSQAGNKCEWDILIDIAEDKKKSRMDDKTYNALYDFYEKMDGDIRNADASTAYLKLGSGKGYYLNSVGLALFEADQTEDKSQFKQFLKSCGFGKVYKKETKRMEEYDLDPYDFPITRVLDIHKLQPLGWVKLEIEK